MSERTRKVASLVRQVVASNIVREVPDAARLTVTAVDVAPDLRTAVVWIGVLGDGAASMADLEPVLAVRDVIQAAVARQLTTKFVPRLSFKLDASGEYADHISRLIDQL